MAIPLLMVAHYGTLDASLGAITFQKMFQKKWMNLKTFFTLFVEPML